MTLEPKRGERAMVIKNSSGDWGILVGRWDGYKVGIPAKRGNTVSSIVLIYGDISNPICFKMAAFQGGDKNEFHCYVKSDSPYNM